MIKYNLKRILKFFIILKTKKMHLTLNQRSKIVAIYFSLTPKRSINRAEITFQIAAQKKIIISEKGHKRIIAIVVSLLIERFGVRLFFKITKIIRNTI